MDLGLKNRVALVAGASKGLGYAVAEQLAMEGAKVSICARDREGLEAAAQNLRVATGAEVIAETCDVTISDELEYWVDQAVERWGRIDILVNNAGGPPPGTFESIVQEQWEDAVNLTLMPAVKAIRKVLPHMQKARWGRILNMTSISVKQPIPNLLLSNSIRGAVIGMAKTLSAEVAADGITVNNIAPGFFDTERLQALMESVANSEDVNVAEIRDRFAAQAPLGRIGRPREFGQFAAFLCSECSSFITGATFQIDGGLYKGMM